MAFELPALPYAKDALEPHISANTLDFHHYAEAHCVGGSSFFSLETSLTPKRH